MDEPKSAGEIAKGLGLVKRRHFTTVKQVDKLIEAREADSDTGFMGRMLALWG